MKQQQKVVEADSLLDSAHRSSLAHGGDPREARSVSARGTQHRTAGKPPHRPPRAARLTETVYSRPSRPRVKARRTIYGCLHGGPKRAAHWRVGKQTPPCISRRARARLVFRAAHRAPAPRPAPAGTRSPVTPSAPRPRMRMPCPQPCFEPTSARSSSGSTAVDASMMSAAHASYGTVAPPHCRACVHITVAVRSAQYAYDVSGSSGPPQPSSSPFSRPMPAVAPQSPAAPRACPLTAPARSPPGTPRSRHTLHSRAFPHSRPAPGRTPQRPPGTPPGHSSPARTPRWPPAARPPR